MSETAVSATVGNGRSVHRAYAAATGQLSTVCGAEGRRGYGASFVRAAAGRDVTCSRCSSVAAPVAPVAPVVDDAERTAKAIARAAEKVAFYAGALQRNAADTELVADLAPKLAKANADLAALIG